MKLCLAAALLAILAGCSTQQPIPTAAEQPTADVAFNALWDASMDVLWDYRFNVDEARPRDGLIRTFPLVAPHGIECLWRKDAVTAADRCEGSLQTIYHVANVRISAAEKGYCVAVTVEVWRSDRCLPELTSTGEAYDRLAARHRQTRATRTGTGLGRGGDVNETPINPAPGPDRIKIAEDPALAGIIQQKIADLARCRVGQYPQP